MCPVLNGRGFLLAKMWYNGGLVINQWLDLEGFAMSAMKQKIFPILLSPAVKIDHSKDRLVSLVSHYKT